MKRPALAPRVTAALALVAGLAGCGEEGVADLLDDAIDELFHVDIERFEADPDTITPFEVSTLSWRVDEASACEISPGIGSVHPDEGRLQVSPLRTTRYELECVRYDEDGDVDDRDRARVEVTVVP